MLSEWFGWIQSKPENLIKLENTLEKSIKLKEIIQFSIFSYIHTTEKVEFERFPRVFDWYKKFNERKEVLSVLEEIKNKCSIEAGVKVRESCIYKKPKGPILPISGAQNRLITSALPYVNNIPHLGNIIGCVLSADVFARYSRLRGFNTLYVCGTDEYGTATETKALEEGMSCQELCDKYHKLHAEVYNWFEVDFDFFGRTTTEKHIDISQRIFHQIYNRNLLQADELEQLYCVKCDRFLADRYVTGTCPLCGYEDARGDQCDGCGKLLNAIDLINPKCKVCKSEPIKKVSKQLFLDLPKLQGKCEEFVNTSSESGKWTSNGKTISRSWLKEGLKPRCITRDLKWGTPVPLDGMRDKVLYVWFDAPIGYLSITANYMDDWEKWWKNPEEVNLYQFMGKDNVPFHTVIFPCTLLGTGDKWTMLHHLSTTDYLNYEGDKFSKSRGVGVFGNNVIESGIPVSIWRYCLLSNRPESGDSSFSWSDLASRTNSELLANLGNFVNRTLKFVKAKFGSIVPDYKLSKFDQKFIDDANAILKEYNHNMEDTKIRAGLKNVMELSAKCNLYLQESKLDNTLLQKDPVRCGTVMYLMCNAIHLIGSLIHPFMPSSGEEICRQVNAPMKKIPDSIEFDILPGHRIGSPKHLFKRIESEKAHQLFLKYGGEEILKRQAKAAEAAKAAKAKKSKDKKMKT